MNDFTKEDLLAIYGLLEYHYCDSELCFNPNTRLLLKIQSMIENYCEHESRWIDINDRLPDKNYVMAYCQAYPLNFVSMVRFEQKKTGEHYFWDDSLDKKVNVTHWMSLPEAPE